MAARGVTGRSASWRAGADGGYTDAFELICCDCGDHPDVDYRDVSTGLQRIRGPYPLAAESRHTTSTSS